MYDIYGNRVSDNGSKVNAPLLQQQQQQQQQQPHSVSTNRRGFQSEDRKCNDVLFAILFLLFLGGMIVISFIGFTKGHPQNLIPTDEWDQKIIDQMGSRSDFWLQDSVAYLKKDFDVLGGSVVFSLILAIVWIQLLRRFTKFFIYMTLFLGVIAVLSVAVYLVVKAQQPALRYTAFALFGVAAILFLLIIFLRKRIQLTAALFAETCQGVQHNPALFIVGLLVFGIFVVFVVYWMATFVFLYSIPSQSAGTEDLNIPDKFHFDVSVRNLMFYQVFGFFWVTSFLGAVFQMSVAGSISCWYFSRDINGFSYQGSPALKTFTWALSKSIGSLAFGSLILAIIQMINFLLERARQANRSNRFLSILISCIICLFSCVQAIARFVNRFAYVYIGMHGDSFCTASRECFDMITNNAFSVVMVDGLSSLVLFVGKLFGTAITTLATVILLDSTGRAVSSVSVLFVAILSYLVFNIFATIISAGIDTVFVCYQEDLAMASGDSGLYISPELHKLFQQKKARNNASHN